MDFNSSNVITSSYLLANLHCPSCVSNIEEALSALDPAPLDVSPSIVTSLVTVRHTLSLEVATICNALEQAGFEVVAVSPETLAPVNVRREHEAFESAAASRPFHRRSKSTATVNEKRRREHLSRCDVCRAAAASEGAPVGDGTDTTAKSCHLASPSTFSPVKMTASLDKDSASTSDQPLVVIDSSDAADQDTWRATVAIGGMTCASCANSITEQLKKQDWIRSVVVNLIGNSGVIEFQGKQNADKIVEAIEDIGFEGTLDNVAPLKQPHTQTDVWKASMAIGGMTCASCANTIREQLEKKDWVNSVTINLISNSGTVEFIGREHKEEIVESIEDLGYDAVLDTITQLDQSLTPQERKVSIRVDGMFCEHCPARILAALKDTGVKIEKPPTVERPIINISYTPVAPNFTIRKILSIIIEADPAFEPSIYHPPTLEERSRMIREQERQRIQYRILLTIVAAIPTFIIGVVYMSLLPDSNSGKQYLEEPLAGNVSRIQWALFILSTPVYFLAADVFHRRALKELIFLWRPGSKTPILRRFYRFGSMNTLMSLGTSIAYLSSVAELIAYAVDDSSEADNGAFYFDSVVFLTLFLLLGRWIEAYSKTKTGDAVTMLMQLRPTRALLVTGSKGETKTEQVNVDMLELGDVVRVLHGDSPPCDGIIVEGQSKFDEASLTGESRLVHKGVGDEVFSGTVNKDGPVSITITGAAGNSMLDQIVTAVREGQTKRAPIERLADRLTSVFVPAITLIAILTWIIWLSLGESGVLPEDYLDISSGGWPVWSLEFAIAVFVVACPCGLALAAPTALYVGGDLATRHGFLVKGGGEAFEKASRLDCIVFDKTGTLTMGGEPVITDHVVLSDPSDEKHDEKHLWDLIHTVEERSSHTVAKAIVSFCKEREAKTLEVDTIEEEAGRGLSAVFLHASGTTRIIIGNEKMMDEHKVTMDTTTISTLETWKSKGKSVALVAVQTSKESESTAAWSLAVIFGISDPIRPEAPSVIKALKERGTDVWMLSGDNYSTACAIGQNVGIPASNIIAGVMPSEKSDKIRDLQKSLKAHNNKGEEISDRRAIIAMVGDGINDSPALSTADVGIAIGSGSDIAISSAEFVLVTSNLRALLTLLDLSRVVFWRIKLNFAWALVYNCIALPVAAGVLYPIKSNGGHVRLDPVWASLAMAMSSISVVCSSLALKARVPFIGFRARKETLDG